MTTLSTTAGGACEALIDTLRAEFGAVLTARILEAEAADFLWAARVSERYLGQHYDSDDGETELSRVAILSFLDGSWHAGVGLIDGEGDAVALLWQRRCDRRDEAQTAFERAV